MSELRDSAIKLFGKTIPLPLKPDALDGGGSLGAQPVSMSEINCQSSWDHTHNHRQEEKEDEVGSEAEEAQRKRKELPLGEPADNKHEEGTPSQATVDPNNSSNSSCIVRSPGTGPETSNPEKNAGDKEENETTISQSTTPKKPNQILPCPRCNSTDTKFCYFNNYNVNQPRHFCRNCQRYWTAGGSMRNVPVGAGRRKTKNSLAALYHHINIPEILNSARTNACKTGGTVLMFGSDSPNFGQSQSTTSLPHPGKGIFNPVGSIGRCIEKSSDDLSGTASQTLTALNTVEKASECNLREPAANYQASGWSSRHWSSGFPIAFYQELPSYWAYAPPGSAVTAPKSLVPCSGHQDNSRSTQSSIKLGKHLRDGNILAPEKAASTPETSPMDDCCKTSKRSIVGAVFGSGNSERLTQPFESNAKGKNLIDIPLAMQANPAALCRSLNFQESM